MLYIVEGNPVGDIGNGTRAGDSNNIPERSSPAGGGNGIQPAGDNGPAGDVCSAKVHSGTSLTSGLLGSLPSSFPGHPSRLSPSLGAQRCRAPGNSLRLVSEWVGLAR